MASEKFISVSEDSVRSYIYSLKSDNLSQWEDLRNTIQQLIQKLSLNYIWHKEKFVVLLPLLPENSDLPKNLHSSTQFGDNIEDIWFIVYLLMEITNTFDHLVVQVNDDDGEFLLIEAADVLPNWINPDNTENRVFLHKGQLHIIPPSIINCDKEVTIQEALHVIKHFETETKAPQEVQNAILKCVHKFHINQSNIHRAIVELPLPIAAVLTLRPSLISSIVESYCQHDVIDAKLCKNLEFKDTINVTVNFTKCLYATVTHMKPLSKFQSRNTTKRIDLGMKLTAGYQMLVGKLSSDIFSTKEWIKFVNNLKSCGYFKENLEGSKDYVRLLEVAKNYFVNTECSTNVLKANEINDVICSEQYKNQCEILRKAEPTLIEDSDDWLNIHPKQLEDLLNARYGKQVKFQESDNITPQTITNQLSKFLKQTSDFEGIETGDTSENEDLNINFNVDLFSDTLKSMLEIVTSGECDSDIELTDDDDISCDDATSQDAELKQVVELLGLHNGDGEIPKSTFDNLTQSIQEEGCSSGPSSNLLQNIGIHKTKFLQNKGTNKF